MQRLFKVVDNNGSDRKYVGQTPKHAASKEASRMFRDQNKKDVNVTVQDTSSNETYSYNVKRVPLSQPMKIKLPNGKEIEYTTRNEIRKIKPQTIPQIVPQKAPKETRYFTLVSYGSTETKQGRYTGSFPKQAASKCFTRLCRGGIVKNNKKIIIIIKETTRGSNKKTHSYECIRQKLSNPQNIQIGGASITYEYENIIKKINQ